MVRKEIVGYLIWFATGVVLTAGGLGYGLGTPKHPGSGFIFFLSGASIILLSGGLTVRTVYSIRKQSQETYRRNTKSTVNLKKLLIPFASMLIYCFLLEALGFLISASMLIFSLNYWVGKKSMFFSLIISITISLLSYMFFAKWLGVQLPAGIIHF